MRYFVELDGTPAMAEEEALALWRRASERDDAGVRDALVENFQPMIAAEAGRLAVRLADDFPGGAPAERFAAWGNLGLLRALCCYRPDATIGFYQFCRRRVCETMLEEARAFGATPHEGLFGASEVARLWGALSREFFSPAFGVIKLPSERGVPGGLRLGVG